MSDSSTGRHRWCPKCRKPISLAPPQLSRTVWCPHCGHDFVGDQAIGRNDPAQRLSDAHHKGFLVGKYKLLKLIGTGGMGRVYLAEHTITHQRVALKVLPITKSADASALSRLVRAARITATLDHRNIASVYDIDKDGDLHYIVTELVEGLNVSEYVKQRGLISPANSADLIRQAAAGLQYVSEAEIVHRDIKPANLLIQHDGTVKIVDLGLALFHGENQAEEDPLQHAYDANVLGTADYMAPEQAIDSRVDVRADIYSLGCSFYFMLGGVPPFSGGTIAQKLLWHQKREPVPIEEKVSATPAAVAEIVGKMMAKRTADRYQTPAEVERALGPHATPLGTWK